jgi:rod shape-determining protein MreC
MRRVHEWLTAWRDHLALGLVIVTSVALMLANDRSQVWTMRAGFIEMYGFFQEKLSWFQELQDVRQENQELRRISTALLLENSRLREAYLENQRLRSILGFKSRSQMDLIPARVIGRQSNGLINAIVLDAGEKDGIHKNMPLVTAKGLVGRVYEATEHNALGQILTDRNFKVSARIQRSRVTGILSWVGGNRCELRDVPLRSDVRVGDVVVTSGYSSIYPPGIKIGVVTKVNAEGTGLFMDVEVVPQVDFGTLEEVCAIRPTPAEQ